MKRRGYLKEDERVFFENRKSEAEKSLEELKKAGNIQEAAVVFSQEGMKLFADMFGNTMRSMVDEAVDRKMRSVLEGMMEGMVKSVFDSTIEHTEREIKEEPKPDPQSAFRERVKEHRESQKTTPSGYMSWTDEEDREIVRQYRKEKGQGMSDNKALDHVVLENRTTAAIKNRWHKEIKTKQYDLLPVGEKENVE
jgi:hypothetical protein